MSTDKSKDAGHSKGGGGKYQKISRPGEMSFSYELARPDAKVLMFEYLHRDPSKSGTYTLRPTLPPHATQAPHFHPRDEYGIVISGVYYTGDGNVIDESIDPLPVGTFGFIPAGCHHYAFTKDEPAVVQVHGEGPWEMIVVDPDGYPVGSPVTLPPR